MVGRTGGALGTAEGLDEKAVPDAAPVWELSDSMACLIISTKSLGVSHTRSFSPW